MCLVSESEFPNVSILLRVTVAVYCYGGLTDDRIFINIFGTKDPWTACAK
jgi:hypothetical protein